MVKRDRGTNRLPVISCLFLCGTVRSNRATGDKSPGCKLTVISLFWNRGTGHLEDSLCSRSEERDRWPAYTRLPQAGQDSIEERHRGSHRGGLTKRRKGAQGLIVRPLASSGIHWNYNGGPAANFFHNLLFGRPIESHRE